MPIKFKCPHCKKPLAVKDNLAGKRGACPACKKPLVIPAPVASPADLEAFAAAALSEQVETPKDDSAAKPVEFDCPMCGDPVKAAPDLAGKQMPCPQCRNIIKVPLPKADKPKDWRDLAKKGPAAALINQPEQLQDAWGTEVKTRVSGTALLEAGAVEIEIESVGVGGWIKRALIGSAALLVIALVAFAVVRNRAAKGERDVIKAALDLKEERAKDPKKKLHAVLAAEIERAAGILNLRHDKRDAALDNFTKARYLCLEAAKDSPLDHDLFLIDLALTQYELAGTEDQIRSKTRFDLRTDVIAEMTKTLRNLKSPEAKVIAVRELGSFFAARNEPSLAINLAIVLAAAEPGGASPVQAQLAALMFAYDDVKKLDVPIKPPDASKKEALTRPTRLAYAEGYARKGQLDKARELTTAPGFPHDRLDAALGVAGVLIGSANHKEAAGSFVAEAVELINTKELPSMSAWQAFQLCRVAYRTEHAGKAKEYAVAQKLPAGFKNRLSLEWTLANIEKGKASADLIKDFPDKDAPPARTLAWMRLAGRLGNAAQVSDDEGDEASVSKAFADIGRKLGQHEPAK